MQYMLHFFLPINTFPENMTFRPQLSHIAELQSYDMFSGR